MKKNYFRENEERLTSSMRASYAGQAASQWLELRLQMIGCGMVAGVAVIAVLQHHLSIANPGFNSHYYYSAFKEFKAYCIFSA